MPQSPQWQIDIPSLSQLILNAGAHGLKQLALAGVDPHTIGCTLMIANYTPASQGFRTKLSKAREQQRLDRVWLYKLVEVGTCTNFLADQMLKTRAGENVVALMAAVATVMDEENCTAVLLALFDAAKVSLDNTPGIAQLQNLRGSLFSLACMTGFAEKTLQYHHFFLSLLGRRDRQTSQSIKGSPYEGLPDARDIPRLIQLMHRLLNANDQRCVVRHRGLRGAAWMAAYTSYVLGLGACAVRPDGTPVPISSSYDDARVIFEIAAQENTGGLYLERDVEDLISLETSPPLISSGWQVDCSKISFVHLHHPDLQEAHAAVLARISTFAAIEAINDISTISFSFNLETSGSTWYQHHFKDRCGLVSFTHAALPQIQQRAIRILTILGFRPPKNGYLFRSEGDVETYVCVGHESDPETTFEEYIDSEGSDDAGPSHGPDTISFFKRFRRPDREDRRKSRERPRETFQSRRGQGQLAMVKENALERLKYYLDDYTNPELQNAAQWPLPVLRDLVESMTVAVHVAARLAFTDWDANLRIISANTMSYRELPETPAGLSNFEGHITQAIALCSDNLPIDSIERLWNADWMVLDIDGIVILRNAAMPNSWASMRGAFLSFRRGRILHENQHYRKIRTDRINTLAQSFKLNRAKWTSGLPGNGCPSIRSRSFILPMADTIFLRLEATLRPGISVNGDGSLSAKLASDYLVTTPCEHGYVHMEQHHDWPRFIHSISAGLFFDDSSKEQPWAQSSRDRQKSANIFYQLTSENGLAQWLALQWQPVSNPGHCLRIVQRDCCFDCVLGRLESVFDQLSDSGLEYPVCIIAGKEEV